MPALGAYNHLNAQFAALFAFGVLGASIAHNGVTRVQRKALTVGLLGVGVAVIVAANTLGSAWMAARWYWVDLVFGVGAVCALVLVTEAQATGHEEFRVPSRCHGGSVLYSIYLMHEPVLRVLDKFIVEPLGLAPLASFALLLIVILPIVLACCYAFFRVFERPVL